MLQIVNSLNHLESYDTDVLSVFDLHLLPRLDKWLLESPKRFLVCIEKNLQAFLQAKAQLQNPQISWILMLIYVVELSGVCLYVDSVAINEEGNLL